MLIFAMLERMQPQTPNPYAFITNPAPPPRQSPFSGWSMRRRVIVVAVGIILVLMLVSIISNIMSSAERASINDFKRVVARQNEIIRVADLAATSATTTETRTLALNISLSVSSDKVKVTKLLTDAKIKLSPQDAAARLDRQTDAVLTAAASNNRYDETFEELIAAQLSDYQSLLRTAHDSSGTETGKTTFLAGLGNAATLSEALRE